MFGLRVRKMFNVWFWVFVFDFEEILSIKPTSFGCNWSYFKDLKIVRSDFEGETFVEDFFPLSQRNAASLINERNIF